MKFNRIRLRNREPVKKIEGPAEEKRFQSLAVKGFAALLAVMLAFTVISRAAASFTIAQVETECPSERKIDHTVTAEGIVEKNRELAVVTQPGLLVKTVYVSEGEKVSAGTVLALLEPESLKEAIDSLENEIQALALQNEAAKSNTAREQQERDTERNRAREDYQRTMDAQQALVAEAEEQLRKAQEALEAFDLQNNSSVQGIQGGPENWKQPVGSGEGTVSGAGGGAAASGILNGSSENSDMQGAPGNGAPAGNGSGSEGAPGNGAPVGNGSGSEGAPGNDASAGNGSGSEGAPGNDASVGNEDGRDKTENTPEQKAALRAELENAVTEARNAYEAALRGQEQAGVEAARRVEDAGKSGVKDTTIQINNLSIGEKEKELQKLRELEENGGTVTAPVDGVITRMELVTGQRTMDTAAVTMADISSGMRFVANISEEDGKYVAVGDGVTIKAKGKEYGDLQILSLEQDSENEMVTVTVLLGPDTLSIGDTATLETSKQSDSYPLTVPVSAIRVDNSKYFVLVIEEEETVLGVQLLARRVDVTVEDQNGRYAAISSEMLSENSRIITLCEDYIKAGDHVRLRES